MNSYQLTPQAQLDLDEIADFIANEASIERARVVIQDLRDAFRKLADMPGMGHFREDLLDHRYKFWSVYSYVIAYRWEATPIQVIAVVHGSRDLAAFLSNRVV